MAKTNEPKSAREISQDLRLPRNLVANLLKELAMAKIIKSNRGVYGGYYLANDPRQINILEIINCIEGPLNVARCVKSSAICGAYNYCESKNTIRFLQNSISNMLEWITVFDMLQFSNNEYHFLGIGLKRDRNVR